MSRGRGRSSARARARDLGAALGGLAVAAAVLYVLGALMMGVRMTTCEDQCEADRLAAVGQKL